MRKIILALTMAASTLVLISGFSAPARAQYCEGTVHGLSGRYNPATGAGFLAVRAGPRSAATQVGELFNHDKVEVFQRRGNWYKIAATDSDVEGWVNARWLWNDCRY
jgi:Bacterial SH3 domain